MIGNCLGKKLALIGKYGIMQTNGIGNDPKRIYKIRNGLKKLDMVLDF